MQEERLKNAFSAISKDINLLKKEMDKLESTKKMQKTIDKLTTKIEKIKNQDNREHKKDINLLKKEMVSKKEFNKIINAIENGLNMGVK